MTQRWVAILSPEYPTIALHASLGHLFGMGGLINLFREVGKLHISKNRSVWDSLDALTLINFCNQRVESEKGLQSRSNGRGNESVAVYHSNEANFCCRLFWRRVSVSRNRHRKCVARVELVTNSDDFVDTALQRVRPEYIKTYKVDK